MCGAYWPADVFLAQVLVLVVWACAYLVLMVVYLYEDHVRAASFCGIILLVFSWAFKLGIRPLIRQRRKLNISA